MEPFEVSLNQVNFEEEAFGDSDELHSFSNLVSYDSDFKADRSEGFPVRSRRIKQYGVADSFHFSQVNHMARVMDESKINVVGPIHVSPVSKGSLVAGASAEFDDEINGSEKSKGDALKISDSFKAFTETVEALALQKSVIGKKRNIVPASADEVARVVAATRARLNNEHRHKSSDSLAKGSDAESVTCTEDSYSSTNSSVVTHPELATSTPSFATSTPSFATSTPSFATSTPSASVHVGKGPSKADISGSLHVVEVYSHDDLDSSHEMQTNDVGHNPGSINIEPEPLTGKVVEAKNVVTEANIAFGSRQSLEGFGILSSNVGVQGASASAGSPSRIPERKELIRITPKEMSTATKKSQSSWFWSKSSNEVATPKSTSNEVASSKQDSARRTQTLKNAEQEETRKKTLARHEETSSSSGEVKANSSPDANQILQHDRNDVKNEEHSSVNLERDRVEVNVAESSKIAPAVGLTQMVTTSPEAQNPVLTPSSRALSSNSETRATSDALPQHSSSDSGDAFLQHSSGDHIRNDPHKMNTTSAPSLNSTSLQRSGGKSEEFQQTVASAARTSSANEIYRRRPIHDTVSLNSDLGGRRASRQDSVDSAFSGSKDDLQLRMEQILKEKVKLEGQVEVLEVESSGLLRERAELQTKVAGLMQELQSREKTRVGLAGDRDALSADLETLRQNRARLEAVIMDAHKLLEDKDQDLKTLENDLELAKDAGEKHLDKLKQFQVELRSRDATITDLKTKITELYVEFQTTNQNRILADNEVGSLQGELKSMAAAKEWYKDQLQFSQREKAELQSEVTRVKAEMIAQGTAIERLKAENQRSKRQLAESEQRSLNEKQTLARHLESIESDMMEREAAFAQMQKDRQNVSDALDENTEGETVAMLTEDLSKATSELKRSHGRATVLQHEQTELVKRLALSQESILGRDKAIDLLEKSVVELESQLKKTQLEFTTRTEEIERLEHDRTVLQMELKSAKEEKEVFDSSLRSLKDDMSVVEKSFRLMKQELLTKQADLDRLKGELENSESRGLEIVPEQSNERLREITQGFEFSPIHSIVRSLTKYQSTETQTSVEPDGETGEDSKVDSQVLKCLEEEKQLVEKQLVAVQQLLEVADNEKQLLSKNLLSVEQELVVLRERSLDLELKLQRSYEERENVEHNLVEEERHRVDEKLQASADHSEEMVQLQAENSNLRSKVGDLQRESHKEIARQKTKALKLGKQLEMALKEHRETCRVNDLRADELNQRLITLEESNARLEGELTNAHQRATLDQDDRMSQMHLEFQRVTEELEVIRNAKHSTEAELNQVILRNQLEMDDYKTRSAQLESELESARNYIEERRVADAETANLALELEREKGRLAGFLRSHTTLKEHASLLEASLANKESSVVQMSSEVEDLLQARNRQIQDLTEQVHLLEEGLAKAQQNTKDTRKQLMTEKGNHIKVRRELEQLSTKHNQIVDEVEQLRKELLKMTEDAEAAKSDQVEQKMKMEQLLSEMKTVRLERDRMARDLEDRGVRDSTLHEQIQLTRSRSLEWKLSQKVAEMTAAEEKAQLVDERRQAETQGLNQSLQASTSELYLVRDELATTKHERAELKARVTQLRQVLMSIIEQCTKATEAGKAITIQMIMNKDELQQLLEESSTPSIQSKPLSFLQATLNGLRGEISSLQVQVNEHTSVVQTSSQAWRQLEAQMEDLREVCKSSAAQRAASDKLLKTTGELSQLTDIQMALQLPSAGPLVLPGSMVSVVKTTSSSSTSTTFSRTEMVENERT